VPGVRRALRNRPFRILLTSYVVGSAASAIPGTFMPFFNAYVIRPDNQAGWLAAFLAAYFGAGFLFLPAWMWAARRFGKKPAGSRASSSASLAAPACSSSIAATRCPRCS
jgi:Na+/melibiose symporter-like transporter